jgi:hypothetical protein
MEPEPFEIGRQLGHEGVDHVIGFVERYCECERQRIELVNQARIIALRAEIALFMERERDLKEALRHAPPLGDLRSRRRKALYHWGVVLVLTVAAFFFSLLAFDPYRLGWKSYLYCFGVAIVTPYCVEKFLVSWDKERLIKALATVAFVAAISSLVLLALVRGDVLAQQIKDAVPVVTFGDDNLAAAQPQDSFYEETLLLLRLVMALLALAMELGSGLALHDAHRLGAESGIDPNRISAELAAVHTGMVSRLHELTALENEAGVFEARFWRDFYRSMLTHTARNALSKLLLLTLGFLILLPGRVFAADHVNLVVLVDLTQSVNVTGHDTKTELDKNLQGVTQLLMRMPAGSHVAILGITDHSFAQPYILLSADIGDDEGYFKERLANARNQLALAWRKRTGHLEQGFRRTDLLGALLLAGQLFQQLPPGRRNMLVILSDMRQNTSDLNLEMHTAIVTDMFFAKIKDKRLVADLRGIEVYVLGADNAGRDVSYWSRLHEFWCQYFHETGGRLERYSTLRNADDLSH